MKQAQVRKPAIATGAAMDFITGAQSEKQAGQGVGKGEAKKTAQAAISGLVPSGDVRLTANIRQDLHTRLKIAAAHRRTTIGELIEELIEQNC